MVVHATSLEPRLSVGTPQSSVVTVVPCQQCPSRDSTMDRYPSSIRRIPTLTDPAEPCKAHCSTLLQQTLAQPRGSTRHSRIRREIVEQSGAFNVFMKVQTRNTRVCSCLWRSSVSIDINYVSVIPGEGAHIADGTTRADEWDRRELLTSFNSLACWPSQQIESSEVLTRPAVV